MKETSAPASASTEVGARQAPFHLAWWMPLVVLLSALFVRLLNLGWVRNFNEDLNEHVLNAFLYQDGLLGPDSWWTQPLKHPLLRLTIALFGNDLIGYRMRGVLFGSAAVLAAFLVARQAFRRPMPAIFTAVLLTLDPLLVAFSHSTHEDVPATFFLLAAVWFFLRGLESENSWDWGAAGVLFGCGLALRWYVGLVVVLVLAIALVRRYRRGAPEVARLLTQFGLIPFTVYVASYLPWLTRGYSPPEFVLMQLDAYHVQGVHFGAVPADTLVLAGPQRWMTGWVGGGFPAMRPGVASAYTVMMNDPVLWFFFVPSALYLAYLAWKRRRIEWGLIAAVFLMLYAFFLGVRRPILLYSALPIIPFGFMACGFAAAKLARRWSWAILGAAAAWSLYLLPLSTAMPADPTWYAWLLSKLVIR